MNPLALKIQKEKRILMLGVGVLLLLVAMYMYFVSAAIIHVVVRGEVDQAITELNSEIGMLETKFIAAQHNVSADISSLAGFVEVDEKIFIERNDSTLVLSANIQ